MDDYPTKYISPLLARRLFDFIHDEEINLKNALYDLAEDLHFFDDLIELYSGWLNQDKPLLAGETKYYAFCALARSQIFQACSSYGRHHFSAAMVAVRFALESAFYAEMMAKGYLSEYDYINDPRKRSLLSKIAWAELKKGDRLDDRVRDLLRAMNMLSDHGAHPSPRTWCNRIISEGSANLSLFQKFDDVDRLKYHFLGILWHGGMALESFFHIGRDVFQQETAPWLRRLDDWKNRMEENKKRLNIQSPQQDGGVP